ncbi:MAG: MerR family transcriptional regulator [Muribaculaceae bacterium]|nr:MerR family transcriptional regulator [Muribaculaceae bacterium]
MREFGEKKLSELDTPDNEVFDKKYYRIRDVAEMLDLNPSTLRYWEQEFPELKPRRSATRQRYYTADDINLLRIINFLVRVKGLRVEAAKAELNKNRKNVSKRIETINLLTEVRAELEEMLAALSKRK